MPKHSLAKTENNSFCRSETILILTRHQEIVSTGISNGPRMKDCPRIVGLVVLIAAKHGRCIYPSSSRALYVQGGSWPLNRVRVEVEPLLQPNWIPMISPAGGGPRGIIVPILSTDPEYLREVAPLIPSDPIFVVCGRTSSLRSPRVIQVRIIVDWSRHYNPRMTDEAKFLLSPSQPFASNTAASKQSEVFHHASLCHRL
jgi:hypothetical protein